MTPNPVSFCIAQDMVAVRADPKKVYPKYLFALLRSQLVQAQIGNMHVGTLIPHFKKGDFDKLLLTIHDKKTQEAIGDTYFELSAKIELNRRMNATLEAMARALFQCWFVDFDPVRAKHDGRKPINCEGNHSTIFPKSFYKSELGETPVSWKIVSLGDVLDVLETGRRPKGGVASYTSGVPSIGAESIWGIGQFDYSKTKFIPREFYDKTSAGRVKHNDVLLYKDGGKPGVFKPRVGLFGHNFPFPEFCINEHVFRMRSELVGQTYLYFAVADQRVLHDFANKGGKAAIPGINQVDVKSTKILLPSQEVLKAFSERVTPLCDLIIKNSIQARTLATLRDTLLPKLLSGELNLNKPQSAKS